MIWIGDGPEPSGGSRNRNTAEAHHHHTGPCPALLIQWSKENKKEGKAIRDTEGIWNFYVCVELPN